MERQTKIFYDLANKQTEEAARLYARVEELEALLADALYLFRHPDRVRKLVMIDRIEQALEGDDDGS